MNANILIVDDDKNTREGLQRALKNQYKIYIAESAESALNILHEKNIDIILSDLQMPGMDGLSFLKQIKKFNNDVIFILLTAYGDIETAVNAMKNGAYDFLTKPVNLNHLELLFERAIKSMKIEKENTQLHAQLDEKYGMDSIIGESEPMQKLFNIIKQVAPTQATVLIHGESGTGKELVANAIHRLSSRNKAPFIPVNCAALSKNLLESELFGHEKGSFTGATNKREGRFELADTGTLFLDEISEMSQEIQVKLLRVLEEQKFERVGGSKTIEVDIRLITATNKDLKEMADNHEFREDLYYRLNVVKIFIPPLRERVEDIPLLCHHFISEFNKKNNKSINSLDNDTIKLLEEYPWKGNVRELRNVIEKMVVLASSDTLTKHDIPEEILAFSTKSKHHVDEKNSMADVEKELILNALKDNNQNITKAAEQLGISRRTLHRKLNKYKENDLINN
ncbi:MAG: sigma-54 dependent transcriptional regulator [Kiritimatiellae bacterium]|jgi:two-component system response regulator AtoC|nr:sigma-54 dependent transcriptional regulator [Kiritimatiellia bacterium]